MHTHGYMVSRNQFLLLSECILLNKILNKLQVTDPQTRSPLKSTELNHLYTNQLVITFCFHQIQTKKNFPKTFFTVYFTLFNQVESKYFWIIVFELLTFSQHLFSLPCTPSNSQTIQLREPIGLSLEFNLFKPTKLFW